MAKSLSRSVRGVRQPIPAGFIVGRPTGAGTGNAQLIPLTDLPNQLARAALPVGGGGSVTSAMLDSAFGNTEGNILQRGPSVWQVLAPGTVNQVLMSGGAAALNSWESVSALLDAVFGSTEGQILQRGASAWQVLAPGTAGQVLTSGGAAALNAWAAATVAFNNRAAWNGFNAYNPLDIVQYNQNAFLNYTAITAPAAGATTLDPSNIHNVTLSGGNLIATSSSGVATACGLTPPNATQGAGGLKLYFEWLYLSNSSNTTGPGIVVSGTTALAASIDVTNVAILAEAIGTLFDGTTAHSSAWSGPVNSSTWGGMAFDFNAGKFWIASNAASPSWQPSGNPGLGTGGQSFGSSILGKNFNPFVFLGGTTNEVELNLGATSFAGSLPSGFSKWNIIASSSPNTPPDQDDAHWLSQGWFPGMSPVLHALAGGL